MVCILVEVSGVVLGNWPAGVQCVVVLTFDVDGPSAFINRNANAVNNPSLMSMGEYGPKIAMPRILDMLDSYNIKASFFVPGYIAENHEGLLREIVGREHEIGHHGYMHEPPHTLASGQEYEVLKKGLSILERLTGTRPLGYRSPAWELSPLSLDYLVELGFTYDSSLMGNDAPFRLNTANGSLVELPIHWLLDDFPHFTFAPALKRFGPLSSPVQVYESWKAEFEGLYQIGSCFHLTMHPYIIGRPGRLLMLERLIEYMRTYSNVCFLRAIDVANMLPQ